MLIFYEHAIKKPEEGTGEEKGDCFVRSSEELVTLKRQTSKPLFQRTSLSRTAGRLVAIESYFIKTLSICNDPFLSEDLL